MDALDNSLVCVRWPEEGALQSSKTEGAGVASIHPTRTLDRLGRAGAKDAAIEAGPIRIGTLAQGLHSWLLHASHLALAWVQAVGVLQSGTGGREPASRWVKDARVTWGHRARACLRLLTTIAAEDACERINAEAQCEGLSAPVHPARRGDSVRAHRRRWSSWSCCSSPQLAAVAQEQRCLRVEWREVSEHRKGSAGHGLPSSGCSSGGGTPPGTPDSARWRADMGRWTGAEASPKILSKLLDIGRKAGVVGGSSG